MYAVILAGGGGTRLWPLSRPDLPKPFIPLIDNESLLQRTVDRLSPLVKPDDVYVVTIGRYAELVREQLPTVPAVNLLAEPVGRNSAAAVAYAAAAIDRPQDEVMVVLPSDHQIADEEAFRAALALAAEAAADGTLLTLGIRPTGPETAFGYILAEAEDELGAEAEHQPEAGAGAAAHGGAAARARGVEAQGAGARRVERFLEKPDVARALELLASGRAYWNAGIFVWRRDALLGGLEEHAPDILRPMLEGLAAGTDPARFYPDLRSISVDYALLEPASLAGQVRVVPMDVGWSDLGNWSALLDALARQGGGGLARGVVRRGRTEDLDSEDVLVHSAGGRLVVTIGLRGTIVVDTPDAVLVCARDRAQDVKAILERLASPHESEER